MSSNKPRTANFKSDYQRKKWAEMSAKHFSKFGRSPAPFNSVVANYNAKKMSGTNGQAMRTGGWANPSKGGEVKFLDAAPNSTLAAGLATWGTGGLLNGCANGSDASTRIGRKITMKSILVKYSAKLQATSTGGSPIRILVVYDKQANATAPVITDILLTDHFLSQNNLSNRDRFTTIFDHVSQPVSVNSEYCVADTLYKRINLETMFNAGSAGTIGDITSGSVYIFVAQSADIGVAGPLFASRVRVRYTDV